MNDTRVNASFAYHVFLSLIDWMYVVKQYNNNHHIITKSKSCVSTFIIKLAAFITEIKHLNRWSLYFDSWMPLPNTFIGFVYSPNYFLCFIVIVVAHFVNSILLQIQMIVFINHQHRILQAKDGIYQ